VVVAKSFFTAVIFEDYLAALGASVSLAPSNLPCSFRSSSLEWWSNHSPQPGTYGMFASTSFGVDSTLPSCMSFGWDEFYVVDYARFLQQRAASQSVEIRSCK